MGRRRTRKAKESGGNNAPVDPSPKSPPPRGTQPAKPTYPLKLPDGLWMCILESDEPGYFDLKRLMRVSTGFQRLMESKLFDGLLFRGISELEKSNSSVCYLHPLLELGNNFIGNQRDSFTIQTWPLPHREIETVPPLLWDKGRKRPAFGGSTKFIPIIDIPCAAHEFATFPPQKFLRLQNVGSGGSVQSQRGVTVLDVIIRIEQLWGRKIPSKPQTYFADLVMKQSRRAGDPREMVRPELHGWELSRIDGGNNLVLARVTTGAHAERQDIETMGFESPMR
ncbi:hypothetical protein T439DRAFT_380401 [Meredithblackwellia eburnea MCA 4105]